MMSLLDVQDIHAFYGNSHVLQGVSVRIKKGQVVAILGRNGAGKTTLVHSIIGFHPIRRGRVLFKDREITRLRTHRISKMGIALIPQGRRIFSSLTVRENLSIASRGGVTLNWSVDDVLSLFPNLRARFHSRGRHLSGGEQQMLACGRALVGNPDLLMLDEPSEGLAPLMVRELGRIIREIKDQGLSMLLVEQNPSFALGLADYVYVMNRGQVVYQSDPASVRGNTEIATKYLGV
jgi:branched-chain amino acid transport system ATP-binding protein